MKMLLSPLDQSTLLPAEEVYKTLRGFRIKREAYFRTYYPRFDLLTGEPIPFKDVDQYLTTDFANKNNLKRWFKERPVEEGLAWSKAWLSRRMVEKQLVYAPSQTELRTLCCPVMAYYEAAARAEGGYYGITEALGYKPRYVAARPVVPALHKDAVIIQDTREQTPVKLIQSVKVATLNVGDYALAAPHDKGIRIERKSLIDFCGTLSRRCVKLKGGRDGTGETADSPFARFDRELARAAQDNLYVVMMVEASIEDAQRIDHLPQTKWVKASAAHVLHNLRELLTKYPLTFQAVFVDGRRAMAETLPRVLALGEQVKQLDLQWLHEEKVI